MPGRDRTGPEGKGSLTGRGMGYCTDGANSNQTVPARRRQVPVSDRMGLGQGLRRGFCGGFRGGYGRGFGRGLGRGSGRGPWQVAGRGIGRFQQNDRIDEDKTND